MRFGGPIFGDPDTPQEWAAAVRQAGYRAAYCPAPVIKALSDESLARQYELAAREADIVIAEVGVWNNPLSPDEAQRHTAITRCQELLALADRIGARCCVNIVGSCSPTHWDGPHPDNFTSATFDAIVQVTRQIIDAVRPNRAFYTLETMPWIFPDSPDSYLALLKAIDRKSAGVHLDPVNMINTPRRCFDTGAFLRECFAKLGPLIKSCHAKDIAIRDNLTVHLDEVRPGLGALNYAVYLRELANLDPDTTLMLEHLPSEVEYTQAAAHVRAVAYKEGITL